MKTLKQKIEDLNWFDFIRKIKEILFSAFNQPLSQKLQAGNNITLEGDGTDESPLKINSLGEETPPQNLQQVLDQGSIANINSYVLINNQNSTQFANGTNLFQINNGTTTYSLDFTGKDYIMNSVGNGQIFTRDETGITLDGQNKNVNINAPNGIITATAQGNTLKLEQGKILLDSALGVNIVNSPNTNNTVTKGLSRNSNGDLVQFDLGVSGTFTAPTSITVQNGIITAIS